MKKILELQKIKKESLKTLLGLYKRANAGHIGASLSCLDILIYLHFNRMQNNDEFLLSKGHAAAALYTVLAKSGRIDEKQLQTYYTDGTLFAAHPPCNCKVDSITFGTGSLGHGLSLASGIAMSAKYSKKKLDVYCVLSEGDCNEGSTWEAALFASQHKLANLTAIIDNNGLQGFGSSKDVLDLEPLKEKWKAFNFETISCNNGNDFAELDRAFKKADASRSGKPKCIIAKTIKGNGISYMQNKMEWHYLPMSDGQYEQALEELGLK